MGFKGEVGDGRRGTRGEGRGKRKKTGRSASGETAARPRGGEKKGFLPEPMRHTSGHGNSHTFISAEFINALLDGRSPAVDVDDALAMTVPGIVAHESALKDGEQLSVPHFG